MVKCPICGGETKTTYDYMEHILLEEETMCKEGCWGYHYITGNAYEWFKVGESMVVDHISESGGVLYFKEDGVFEEKRGLTPQEVEAYEYTAKEIQSGELTL